MTGRRLLQEDELLVREMYPSLRRFAAVVGDADMDPDDLVQESLLRVLKTGPLGRLDAPLAYLRTTILRVVCNERRTLARRHLAMTRLQPAPSAMPDYPSDLADLFRLPPQTRAVLFLRDVEGLSYGEIADLLDMNETTARKAASRGHHRLRRLLEVGDGAQ